MAITVRVAMEHDVDAACHVLRRSVTELCLADHNNDEQILTGWLKNKTPEHVRGWVTSNNLAMVVAVRDCSVCGVAMISRVGEIQLCYASPDVRFLGAGKLMLHALQRLALEWGLSERVRSVSSAVRNVYPMVKRIGL